MLTYEVELVELAEQPAAVVRAHVTLAELPQFVGAAFGEVLHALAAQGLSTAGPPFGRYVVTDAGFDAEVGFPATAPVRELGRVTASVLPGGTAAQLLYRGSYDGIGPAYEAVSTWICEHGMVVAGDPWESYLDGPEVAEPRTLIRFPCRPA